MEYSVRLSFHELLTSRRSLQVHLFLGSAINGRRYPHRTMGHIHADNIYPTTKTYIRILDVRFASSAMPMAMS